MCFGSDVATCSEENLYRIIGIFDDDGDSYYQIKLIKADYATSTMLGTDGRDYYGIYNYDISNYEGTMNTNMIVAYRWNCDTSVSSYGSNNWSTSEFNTVNLNTNYINNIGSEWANLISEYTWIVGGNTDSNIYSVTVNNTYINEIVNPAESTTYNAKIGLMYASDYGYAASLENWQTTLVRYNNDTNRNNNWMFMGLFEWTITPISSYSNRVFCVNYTGTLGYNSASFGYAVRPVFYLNSDVRLARGSGAVSDPYILAV